ncbi:MAG: hypothetical protein ACAI34_09575, partial [Verrucomicrobium sp.]
APRPKAEATARTMSEATSGSEAAHLTVKSDAPGPLSSRTGGGSAMPDIPSVSDPVYRRGDMIFSLSRGVLPGHGGLPAAAFPAGSPDGSPSPSPRTEGAFRRQSVESRFGAEEQSLLVDLESDREADESGDDGGVHEVRFHTVTGGQGGRGQGVIARAGGQDAQGGGGGAGAVGGGGGVGVQDGGGVVQGGGAGGDPPLLPVVDAHRGLRDIRIRLSPAAERRLEHARQLPRGPGTSKFDKQVTGMNTSKEGLKAGSSTLSVAGKATRGHTEKTVDSVRDDTFRSSADTFTTAQDATVVLSQGAAIADSVATGMKISKDYRAFSEAEGVARRRLVDTADLGRQLAQARADRTAANQILTQHRGRLPDEYDNHVHHLEGLLGRRFPSLMGPGDTPPAMAAFELEADRLFEARGLPLTDHHGAAEDDWLEALYDYQLAVQTVRDLEHQLGAGVDVASDAGLKHATARQAVRDYDGLEAIGKGTKSAMDFGRGGVELAVLGGIVEAGEAAGMSMGSGAVSGLVYAYQTFKDGAAAARTYKARERDKEVQQRVDPTDAELLAISERIKLKHGKQLTDKLASMGKNALQTGGSAGGMMTATVALAVTASSAVATAGASLGAAGAAAAVAYVGYKYGRHRNSDGIKTALLGVLHNYPGTLTPTSLARLEVMRLQARVDRGAPTAREDAVQLQQLKRVLGKMAEAGIASPNLSQVVNYASKKLVARDTQVSMSCLWQRYKGEVLEYVRHTPGRAAATEADVSVADIRDYIDGIPEDGEINTAARLMLASGVTLDDDTAVSLFKAQESTAIKYLRKQAGKS